MEKNIKPLSDTRIKEHIDRFDNDQIKSRASPEECLCDLVKKTHFNIYYIFLEDKESNPMNVQRWNAIQTLLNAMTATKKSKIDN